MNPIMQSALRIEAKVLPGHKIEIDFPPDTALNTVENTIEVILLLPEKLTRSTEQSSRNPGPSVPLATIPTPIAPNLKPPIVPAFS